MLNRPLRILLVDLEERVRLLLDGPLPSLGSSFVVEMISGYAAALDVLGEARHEVCLLEYRLGAQTGLDLLREAMASGCRVPIILMTCPEAPEAGLAALAAGAVDFFVKSEVDVSLLERTIRNALVRKEAEEAFRRSEEALARMQRIAGIGMWEWDIWSNEVLLSDEMCRMIGICNGEQPYTYELLLDAVPADERTLVNRSVNEAIYIGKVLSIEHRLVSARGGERFVHHRGEILSDDQGRPLRFVGTVQDITERRRTEEGLRHMEETFSKAFNASPDWMAVSNASTGTYLEVNDAFVALTGYTREVVIGKTSVEIGLWVEPAERIRMLKLLDEHGIVRNLEVRFRMKGGEIRWMLWSADVIELRGEACLIAVARDVTEVRELEAELVKSQAELYRKHEELTQLFACVEAGKREWEMTMDHIGDMVILADEQGKIRRCNRAFQEFISRDYEELLGADWVELLHEHDLITGTIFLESMELYHEASGKWYVLNPYPFASGGDGIATAGVVVTIHDATELKRYGEQVERMNRELEQVHNELQSVQTGKAAVGGAKPEN